MVIGTVWAAVRINPVMVAIVAAPVVVAGILLGLYLREIRSKKTENASGSNPGKVTLNRAKRPDDFYCYEHIFKSVVKNLDEMLTGLSSSPLRRHNITEERDPEHNSIRFKNADGTMEARIMQIKTGESEEIKLYRFRVERCGNATVTDEAVQAAKALVTAIEKAFLTLDYNAVLEYVRR